MSTLPGNINTAITNLDSFPNLKRIIDLNKFRAQVSAKYPNGPIMQIAYFDLYTALIVSAYPDFKQAGKNHTTPEGVLRTIDEVIPLMNLSEGDEKILSNKLTNLNTTSLWDTLGEILFFKIMEKNVSFFRLALEYPIGNKDADIALLDESGNVSVLIDVYSPQDTELPETKEQIIRWISKKYDSKFANYCSQNPNAKVAIALPIIKAESRLLGLPGALLGNVVKIESSELDQRQGLIMGIVSTFRSNDGVTLDIVHVAKYERS